MNDRITFNRYQCADRQDNRPISRNRAPLQLAIVEFERCPQDRTPWMAGAYPGIFAGLSRHRCAGDVSYTEMSSALTHGRKRHWA